MNFKDQAQLDVDMWLENELRGKFLSDHRKPTWSFDADWCFHENEPMVFVNQFTDSEGVNLYVLKITTAVDGALKTIYEMFAYEGEDKMVLDGIIV